MSGADQPPYRQTDAEKQQQAEEAERESNRHKENISAINALTNQLSENQQHQDSGDREKAIREKVTIGLLFVTIAVTLIIGVIQHTDAIDALQAAYKAMDAQRVATREALARADDANRISRENSMSSHIDNVNSLGFAEKAAVAGQRLTRESNGINKQAFTATQRAFVLVTGFRQIAITDQTGKATSVEITPIIKNTGNTPATNVTFITIGPTSESFFPPRMARDLRTRLIIRDVKAPTDPNDVLIQRPLGSESLIVSNIYIAPGTEIPVSGLMGGVQMNMKTFNDIAFGRTGGFLYGSIHYSDIFGKAHVSKYCYSLDSLQVQGGGVRFDPPLCGHWNCLDDDCDKDKAAYLSDVESAKRKEDEEEQRMEAIRKQFPASPAPPSK